MTEPLPLPDPIMDFDRMVDALDATIVDGVAMEEWFFRKSRYARFVDADSCDGRVAFVGNLVILECPDVGDSAGNPPWIYVMDPLGGTPAEFSPNY